MKFFDYRDDLLHAEGVALPIIAESVGTPCYVYSQAALEQNWRSFDEGLKGRDATIFYSVKANSNLAVLALLAKLGSGFDIVSGGELQRVIRAGGRPEKTIFSGVGKSEEEIRLALEHGIFSLNLESDAELARIHEIASELGVTAPISIRVNPDVDAKTHPHISTGLREAKFGIPFGEARRIYQAAVKLDHINVLGIAVHIGSQITSLAPIVNALERIIDLAEELASDGIKIQHLDLGGGLGVKYQDEQPPDIAQYCEAIGEVLDRRNCRLSISVEPGRSVTAQAGIMLSKVEYIKKAEIKNFAIVDGAMNDLLRPVLYDAWMEIIPVALGGDRAEEVYDVVGPVCETGDYLGLNRKLAVRSGDLIAVCGAGAYGAVMSSNYNSRPKPAEVMVSGDTFEQIRVRESIEHILDIEDIPNRLMPIT